MSASEWVIVIALSTGTIQILLHKLSISGFLFIFVPYEQKDTSKQFNSENKNDWTPHVATFSATTQEQVTMKTVPLNGNAKRETLRS